MNVEQSEKIVLEKIGITISSYSPFTIVCADGALATGNFASAVIASKLRAVAEEWAFYVAGLCEQGELATPMQEFLELNTVEYTNFLKHGVLLSNSCISRIVRRIAAMNDPVFWELCSITVARTP
nr:hypothetical protein BdHM001_36020 [Bdellovibrio sp. HM001]